MRSTDKKLLLYGLGSVLIGTVIRSAARRIWLATQHTPPPEDLSDPEVDSKQAIAWTVGLALLSGLGKLMYRSVFSDQLIALKEESDIPIDTEEVD
ncbi:MAG: DUF4235 domain-containing protein [Bacteroidota bacterium]